MTEKLKVPTLNLNKVPESTSQLSTQKETAADSQVTFIPGSSFYTQRGATDEYLIPGLG